ncbi:MAG: acyl-CoA dehydratase activase-related protein, partial [Chitinispirillaceae bacterium]
FLSPIANAKKLVRFETLHEQKAEAGDECIVGLDVGSTTTKAVVIRTRDDALLASVYGRTNGNPVQASRECYRELASQIEEPVKIIGLGTTGSGRQIAGLHAQTDSVINEIIAHATAAAHFDKEVDTIFEIGGQDAKYTHLTNGVPSDYAMNEACSAGTGSFLEESAKESLGLDYREIENVALRGKTPPNFNDQCAAFISSDIKTAIHEGIDRDDIVAGLVYSICLNYVNRVKGQRNTGNRVFMQGGVCYNKAVPLAMANLLEKEIVVPPHPGLMGAYGVALEVKQRIELGHTPRSSFDLGALADQQVQFGKHFRCAGGKEKCDRNCQIAVLKINGKSFPFGGACNKYYNQIHHVKHDPERFDYVRRRQQLLFETYFSTGPESEKTVGIPRSYLTNMLLPLWSRFFAECGFKVVLSDRVDPEGIKRTRTSLCYPGEIAHGCFANLLHKKPDAIFLPKILELHVENSVSKRREHQTTCMLLQSEPYYVPCAFKGLTDGVKILTPGFDFSRGWEMQEDEFIELGAMLGVDSGTSRRACSAAVKQLKEFFSSLKKLGQEALTTLERNKDASAVVLFGRPYNAFAPEANMGIPAKFATRGELVIPWDLLPFEDQPCDKSMNWAIGQNLMKTAHYVFKHPQLFATWITNFSCGPDSFLVGYFRDIMEDKPSLTLELDSHTADAGVNTRIEAFMDVVSKWRQIPRERTKKRPFVQAHITYEKDKPVLVSSQNTKHTLYDPNVHVLFPSMGRVTSELAAAAFRGIGIRASSVPVYDYEALKLGRANTSCKECLPLQLVTGGLMKYIKHRSGDDELVAYFMPTCGGNCRFTQYNVFLRKLIEKKRLENIALLTLTNENGYAGLSPVDAFKVLKSFIIADVMTDIRNSLDVLALDRSKAQHIFNKQLNRIIHSFSEEKAKNIYSVLEDVAKTLAQIPRRFSIEEAKKVSLMGEIFVRRDCFSSRELRERLARRDIIVRQAHILEWLSYCDHNVKEGIYQSDFSIKSHLEFSIKQVMQRYYEKKIKRILSRSQLYEFEMVDMKKIMEYGGKFFDRRFTGEVILFAGNYFKDIMHSIHGAVSIGPFACMPTRVTEAVMAVESTIERKKEITKAVDNHADDLVRLPFLSLEMDGNPLPQVLEARIEAFALQVERLHQRMNA